MRCPTLSELPTPPPGKTGWPWTVEGSQMPDAMPDGRPWPKISVVTPSFNQGQFIEETIRSILLQGYPNMEYIIIDGGSTDETIHIIRKYEKWLGYWVSEPDRGQSHAINKGWEMANGDLISWLNSDDYLMPEWARDSVLALVNDSGAELVCTDNLIVDSQSQPLSVFKGTNPILEIVVIYWLGPFPQQGFLMRRRVLSQFGFLDEQLHYTMDFDYWVRLLMKGVKVKYIPKALATLREHPASKTSNLGRVAIRDLLRITEKFVKEAPASLQNVAEKAKKRAHWNAAYGAFVVGDKKLARHYALQYLMDAGLIALPKVFSIYVLSLLGNHGENLFQLYRIFRSTFYKTPYGTLRMNSQPSHEGMQPVGG
jgi:glycosyltransferase involved in cell wall biosynthesis